MGIQINGQTDTITATDGSFTLSGSVGIPSTTDINSGNINVTGVSTFNSVEITGILYDTHTNVGAGDSVLISTGIGVSWIDVATAALQGVQGVQGTQGLQGIQGTQGVQGTFGTQGVQGSFGTQGVQGVQGTQGLQGTQGTQGTFGTQGIQGTFGTQGVQGTQGTFGTQGVQGTFGTQGATGPTGGSSGQVLYNSGGSATSSSNLTFDGTNLTIGGRLNANSQPAFFAYQNGSAFGSSGPGIFDSTRVNVGGVYSTSTGRFTAPVSGMYFMNGQGLPNGAVNQIYMYLQKNGTRWSANVYSINPDESYSISAVISLAANDYVEVYYAGGSESSYCHFTGFLIG